MSAVAAVGAVAGAVAPVAPLGVSAVAPLGAGAAAPAGTAAAADPAGFAGALTRSMDSLQHMQSRTDDLAVQAATGDLTDVSQYMAASTESSLATQLTVAVRNKALDAFNEVMRMQV